MSLDGGCTMTKEILEKIILQVKKYELIQSFGTVESLKKWLLSLNSTQTNNFISLNIPLNKVENFKQILVNCDLLNCKDYKKRVDAISTLKNGVGCWHLFNILCKPNFLNSKNFYKDIEMVSRASTARYALWVLGEDNFINSPYHFEDLKKIVELSDKNTKEDTYSLIAETLATVAINLDSIQSPYHEADMRLISLMNKKFLKEKCSSSTHSLASLAINKISLSDKYHFKNMQILATNPIANEFLYAIMTDYEMIKGKYYREEVKALLQAKSKLTANALYHYITNIEKSAHSKKHIISNNFHFILPTKEETNYLHNLDVINTLNDQIAMYYVFLLLNPNFINSSYSKFDLELLQSISNKEIFMSLYQLMTNVSSLNSSHHKMDAVIISQASDQTVRELLLKKACYEYSLKSDCHEYDMKLIFKLNFNLIADSIRKEIYYYLFHQKGIDDNEHKEKLEQLLQKMAYNKDHRK